MTPDRFEDLDNEINNERRQNCRIFHNNYHKLENKVYVLEDNVKDQKELSNKIVEKMDELLKIVNNHTLTTTKLSTIHEQRIQQMDEQRKEDKRTFIDEINKIHAKIDSNRDYIDTLDKKTTKRLDDISRVISEGISNASAKIQENHVEDMKTYNERVGKLEKFRWLILGFFIIFGGILVFLNRIIAVFEWIF